MRQIYLRLFLVLSVLFLMFAIARAWVIRPINCLPDCTGITLHNRVLQNHDLRDGILVEADLRGSDMRQANLAGADLSGANLSRTNLSNADLSGTRLIGANLTEADLRNTVLHNTNFTGANLTGADLTRTDLTEVQLDGAILNGARLIEVNLAEGNLSGARLRGADLTGSDLSNIVIEGSALSNTDLSGSVLTDANLNGSWLNLANLSGTDLSGANLAGTSLIGSNLSSANLTDSTLVGATAVGADLSGANLIGADLTGVRFFQFELEERDLTTDPALIELNELRLRQVTANANLNGVQFTIRTLWPRGKNALLHDILGEGFSESQLAALTEEIPNPPAESGQPDPAAGEPSSTADDGSGETPENGLPPVNPEEVEGDIAITGSSIVFTITNVIAEQFTQQGYEDTITVESADISESFQRFCQQASTIDIVNSSRPMQDAERAVCATIDREPVRFRIGTDAIAIIVNPSNDFAQDITIEQLATLFTAQRWNDVNSDWPAEDIIRHIPTDEADSQELFINTVFGPRHRASTDKDADPFLNAPNTTQNETDEQLVQGVATEPYAVGFIPFEFYQQNEDVLSLLTINDVELNAETAETGEYVLTRPLLLYTDAATLREKPQVEAFLSFYLANVRSVIEPFGYFASSETLLADARTTLQEAATVIESDVEATAPELVSDAEEAPTLTLPDPILPLSPTNALSPTATLTPTTAPTVTELADLDGPIVIAGHSSVISPTEIIAEGFLDLGFTDEISLTSVSTNQAVAAFCESEQADIAALNRPLADDETSTCNENNRTPLELRVGTNAIVIVANPNNDFVHNITLEDLAALFSAELWSDVNANWPAEPIQRFIPPQTSNAFDLFVEHVLNDEPDQLLLAADTLHVDTPDNQAQAITLNPYAIGFMEYAAYQQNAGLLHLIEIDGVEPDAITLEDNSYPLARPLLLYSDAATLQKKPQVAALLNFYLTNQHIAMDALDYVPVTSQDLEASRTTLRQAVTEEPD